MAGRGRPKSPGLLTPRENDVLALVARRRSNREIAEALDISDAAVRYHLNQIYAKTGVDGREELQTWAGQRRALSIVALAWAVPCIAAVVTVGVVVAVIVGTLLPDRSDSRAPLDVEFAIAATATPAGQRCAPESVLLDPPFEAVCLDSIAELEAVVGFEVPLPASPPPTMLAAATRDGRTDAFVRLDLASGQVDYLAGYFDVPLDFSLPPLSSTSHSLPLAISARSTPHVMGFFDRRHNDARLVWCPRYDGSAGSVENRCLGELAVIMSGTDESQLAMAVLDALDRDLAPAAAVTAVPYPTPVGDHVLPFVDGIAGYPGAVEVDGFLRPSEAVQVFDVDAMPRDVLDFYDQRLTDAGWSEYKGSSGVAGETRVYTNDAGARVTLSTYYVARPGEENQQPPPGYRGKGVPFEHEVNGKLRYWLITRAPPSP